MKRYTSFVMAVLLGMALGTQALEIPVELKNTTTYARTNELTEVSIPASAVASFSNLALYQGNTPIPYQAVRGTNKIVFQATVAAGASVMYTLKDGAPATTTAKTYVAVKNVPSNTPRRDDIAWENDLAAHRMYSKILLNNEVCANGVDLWSKKKAEPIIDKMYTYSNYHAEQADGVDAYSVNKKTLGAGGVAAYAGGKLWLHDPYDECVIVENGPLRSEFVLTYRNVLIDGDYYTKTVRITTNAGGLLDKAVVKFNGRIKPMQIAAGIYLHTDLTNFPPQGVQFTSEAGIIGYAEKLSEGSVNDASSRFYEGVYMPGETSVQTLNYVDDSDGKTKPHLIIMSDYAVGSEFTYYFGGGWNRFPVGRYTSDTDWFNALKQFKASVDSPLFLSSAELPSKAEVINEGIRVNSLWQADHAADFLDNLWYSGVYHAGNLAFYGVYPQRAYLNYTNNWAMAKAYAVGAKSSADADQICVGQAYLDLYTQGLATPANIAALKSRIDGFNTQFWWIDAMYMAMPVFARLGKITGDFTYYEKMYTFFRNCRDTLLVSTNTNLWTSELSSRYGAGPVIDGFGSVPDGLYNRSIGLWYRDWGYQPGVPDKKDPNNGNSTDSDPNSICTAKATPSGKDIFWGRGNGWAIGAMAHTLRFLPIDAPHRSEYVKVLQEMAAALKLRQRADGMWNMSLDDADHRPGGEESGSALITFSLAYGINAGILDYETYYETVARAWNGLVKNAVLPSGVVLKIQGEGEAPISPSLLMNSRTASQAQKVAFGVGAFLCAAAEVAKLASGAMPEVAAPPVTVTEIKEKTSAYSAFTVSFDQPLDSLSLTTTGNYTLGWSSVVLATWLNAKQVEITLEAPLPCGVFPFTVQNIKNEDGMLVNIESTKKVTHVGIATLTAADPAWVVTAIAGTQEGNPPSHTVDRNLGTRWAIQGMGKWINFQLADSAYIKEVQIAVYQGTARKQFFEVQVKQGNDYVTTLADKETAGTTTELQRFQFPTPYLASRDVRVVCNQTSVGDWNSLTEVRILTDPYVQTGIRKPVKGINVNRYYTLQGMQLTSPPSGGIYVQEQAGKTQLIKK